MSETRDLDLLRAHREGRLSAEDRRVLESRLQHEPGLASMARDLDAVWDVPVDPVPACEVTFEDLDLDASPTRPSLSRLPVLAAIGGIAAVLLVAFLVRQIKTSPPPRAASGPVTLTAISLAQIPEAPAIAVPTVLATYAPMGPAGLRFVEGAKQGHELARLAGRPLLLFVRHPDCPLCIALAKGTFKDASLASHVEPFVLAQVSVDTLDASVLEGVDVGWPIFLVYGPDGRRVDAFGGAPDAARLARSLDAVEAKLAPPTPERTLPWESTRAVARDLLEADATDDFATREARLAHALAAAKESPLRAAALGREAALARDAQDALLQARAEAAAGRMQEAIARLDAAVTRHRATRYERDLTAVRSRLVSDHAFPSLEAPR